MTPQRSKKNKQQKKKKKKKKKNRFFQYGGQTILTRSLAVIGVTRDTKSETHVTQNQKRKASIFCQLIYGKIY